MDDTQDTHVLSLFHLCPFFARTYRSEGADTAEIYVHMREDR